VEISINVFMFKLDTRLYLVDTGSGQLFPAGFGGKLLQSLAAAGVRPEQVRDILLTHAHITITYDVDRRLAAPVRKTAFAEFARDRTLIAFPHIPFPGIGHIRTSGTGYEWVPIIYGNRDIAKKWQ
jgi:glyoxylase-like metal-dependent hydrolase (beta-lactamase superfamily II)